MTPGPTTTLAGAKSHAPFNPAKAGPPADFQKNPEVEVLAVCDVFKPNAERARELAGGKAEVCGDYRRLGRRKSQKHSPAPPAQL